MSEVSLSIEETNAMRAKLGLKPLKAGPEISSQKIAEDNLKRQREEEAQKARDDSVKSKIAKARNKRELNKVVAGKGLGEASDDEDGDVFKWTMKSRQKQKVRQAAEAAKREKELQELDEVYQADYDEEHLSGLRVGHDMSDFHDGEERILTLKDSTILDNEEHGDELINIQLSEKYKLEKNLENKKKVNKPVYTGYDDDEFTGGKKKSLLSQYDEVLGTEEGNEGFVIGKRSQRGNINRSGSDHNQENNGLSAKEIMNKKLKESAVALNYDKTQQGQDYYTKDEAEIVFKKSKKKKKSRSRKTENWDDEENQDEGAMEIEKPEPLDISELNFVDDEDLQASLSKARRLATKKAVKSLTPEQIAKNLAESKSMEVDDDHSQKGGLVISDVSEFVSNLSSSAVQIPSTRPAQVARVKDQNTEVIDSPTPVSVEDIKAAEGEMEEDDDDNVQDDSRQRTRAVSEELEDEDATMNEPNTDETTSGNVLDDEPLVSRGLGSTLALLKQKGAYEVISPDDTGRAKIQADRAKWLAESKIREAKLARELARDKAKEKERSRDKNYSIRDREKDREYENQRREQLLLDEREARMKSYKPDIKLEYIDESGNRLNTKEAFRQLSHAFHGKTSGKMKTEKRMKKLEDEKRLMSMSSTDTPLNMVSAFQERQKAAGSAHIVLAVGNRNAVPSSLTSSTIGGTVSTTVSGARPGTSSETTTSTRQPIIATPNQGTLASTSISGVNAPNREKVAFGLKRKADSTPGAAQDESASKKPKSDS
ncbi:hypothetical protein BGZ76_005323 [Entomortierella beljakovae]|nr:hypothetical protein BGZ76_005323 [Entomortierella beljakovae]